MKATWLLFSTLVMAGCAAHRTQPPADGRARPENRSVTIDLQHGFYGAEIELVVDGRQLFSGTATTDDRIGLARSFNYPAGAAERIDIELRSKGSPPHRLSVDLERGTHVGFHKDLDTGQIRHEVSRKPFVYD